MSAGNYTTNHYRRQGVSCIKSKSVIQYIFIMHKDQPGAINHTDFLFESRQTDTDQNGSSRKIDHVRFAYARTALQTFYPELPDHQSNDISVDLVQAVSAEHSRRGAHYHRYRLMANVGITGMLLEEAEHPSLLPEQSLLELKTRTNGMSDGAYMIARDVYGGKGISAELGHVDQLGDWDAARPLDAAVRQLPESDILQQAGFVFGNKYDTKDQAKISWTFNAAGNLIIAKRKRAAADVHAVNEKSGELDTFEIVKQSTFLISESYLNAEHKYLIDDVKKFGSAKGSEQEEREAFNQAGMSIVEPLISERELREEYSGVVAATSLYFALYRHQ